MWKNYSFSSHNRRAGLSLVELTIGVGLISLISVVLGQILFSANNSIDYITQGGVADQELKRVVNRIGKDLALSAPSAVSVNAGSTFDQVTSQRPNPNGNGQWGARDVSGNWQLAWSTRYEVVGTNLVCRHLDASASVISTQTLLQHLDATGSNGKGFEVTENGSVVSLTLRLRSPRRDGSLIEREFSTSVFLKNN